MNRGFLRNGIVTLVLVVGVATLLYVVLLGPSQNAKTIPYAGGTDSLQALVKAGQVANVTQQGTDLQITLTSTNPDGTQKLLESQVPGTLGEGLTSDVATWCAQGGATCNNQMTITAVPESQTGSWIGLLLTTALPLILIGAFFFIMFRQAQGTNNQAMSFGKSRARMFLGNKTVVTFSDVAGVDEAKTELQEVVEFLK